MRSVLHKLDASGDVKITWDPNSEAETAQARVEVETLKQAGYSFFLVDGGTADAVAAGKGTLNCRRASVEELIPLPGEERTPPIVPHSDEEPAPIRRGPGRPPGVPNRPVEAVAVRQPRGG